MRNMRRERRKTAERKQVILEIISQKQPIKTMDLFREVCARLGQADRLSQSTFFYYLDELERTGIIEKTALGWQLNRRGLLRRDRLNYLSELVKDQKLIDSGYADIFGNLGNPFLEAIISREFFSDLIQEAICRFYLQVGFCFEATHAEADQLGEIFELDKKEKLTTLQLTQAFVRSIGYAIWIGYLLSIERARFEVNSLRELLERFAKNEEGVKKLSTFFCYGLQQIFHQDPEVLAFAKVLRRIGFWREFIKSILSLDWVEQVYSHIKNYPSKRGMTKISKLLRLFIEWLMKNELTIIIPISAESLISTEVRCILFEFDGWFTALKEGWLDHRSWIFREGVELLEKLIMQLKRLDPQELKATPLEVLKRVHPELWETLMEPIDPQEGWILEDLFEYHPRGREIRFYEELLEEIRLRSERKLDSQTAGNIDSPHVF